MDKKYWEGISSLNEERSLKQKSDNPYFEELDELAKSEMDWEFDDFMAMEESEKEQAHNDDASKLRRRRIWIGVTAAASILAAGFLFLRTQDAKVDVFKRATFAKVTLSPEDFTDRPAIGEQKPSYVVANRYSGSDKKQQATRPTEVKSTAELEIPEEEAYVIVNGKPIYDEKEAEEIVLASLKIMTTNLQEGKNALEKVRYIQVEL